MKRSIVILIFILINYSLPTYSDSGQYVVYETGLVIPSGADEISFIFSGIDMENEIASMEVMRRNIFLPKENQKITLTEFYNLLIALEQLYVLNGYFLTRFIVPPQTVEEGVPIYVIVYPGKIESIDTTQLEQRIEKPIADYFSNLLDKEGIEYPVIENAIIKSRDLAGVDLETTIKAGNEPGTSALQLNADYDFVDGYFGYSNGLSEAAGKDQFTAYYSLNSLLGYGENIYAAYTVDPQNNDAFNITNYREAFLIGATVPLAPSNYFLFGSYNNSITEPKDLNKKGEFSQVDLGIQYQLKNTRLEKYTLFAGLQWLQEKERATHAKTDTFHDEIHALELKLQATDLFFFNRWSIKAVSTIKMGTPLISEITSDNKTPSRVGATANFIKWNNDIRLNTVLPRQFQLRNNLNFQKLISDRGVINAEQIGITGQGKLSGFASGHMAGDEGYFFRTEVGRTFYPFHQEGKDLKMKKTMSVEPYIHIAAGTVFLTQPASGEYERLDAVNGGLGMKIRLPNLLLSDFFDINLEVAHGEKDIVGNNSITTYLINTSFSF
jgi:hemolysin activation/secretion protein